MIQGISSQVWEQLIESERQRFEITLKQESEVQQESTLLVAVITLATDQQTENGEQKLPR